MYCSSCIVTYIITFWLSVLFSVLLRNYIEVLLANTRLGFVSEMYDSLGSNLRRISSSRILSRLRLWKIFLTRLQFSSHLIWSCFPPAPPWDSMTHSALVIRGPALVVFRLLLLILSWSVVWLAVYGCILSRPSQCFRVFTAHITEFSFIITVTRSTPLSCSTSYIVQFALENIFSRIVSLFPNQIKSSQIVLLSVSADTQFMSHIPTSEGVYLKYIVFCASRVV